MNKKTWIDSLQSSERWFFFAQMVWLGLVFLLTGWWGQVILSQAKRISELEQNKAHWNKIQRMIVGESGTFFLLLMLSSLFLFWLYRRDRARMKSLQSFFASITHELKTPLAGIRLCAESILEKKNEAFPREEVRWLDRLLNDVSRLEAQIEKMLDWARLEAGGLVYLQPIALQSFVKRFLNALPTSLGEPRFFGWSVDQQVEDVLIQADESALYLILKNLIENSLRHSSVQPLQIRIITRREKNQLILILRDNGKGIPEQLSCRQLGQPFQKGPGSLGTGMGLYFIRSLMKQMKGKTLFISEPSGFEVQLFFPILEGENHATSSLGG